MGRPRKSGPRYNNGNRKEPQKKYNKTKKGKAIKNAADNLNYALGTKGNHDGKDASHTGPKKGVLESPHANRGRRGYKRSKNNSKMKIHG